MTIPHQHHEQPADTRPLTYDQAETLYPAAQAVPASGSPN